VDGKGRSSKGSEFQCMITAGITSTHRKGQRAAQLSRTRDSNVQKSSRTRNHFPPYIYISLYPWIVFSFLLFIECWAMPYKRPSISSLSSGGRRRERERETRCSSRLFQSSLYGLERYSQWMTKMRLLIEFTLAPLKKFKNGGRKGKLSCLVVISVLPA